MRKMPKSFSSTKLATFLAIFVLFSDQISKWIVINSLISGECLEITPFFNIVFVENRGITFGMFSGYISSDVLALVSSFIVLALLVSLKKLPKHYTMSASLIIGGAIGNVIDRICRGAVVDFLDFHALEYHWPAFNIADSAIVMGVAMAFIISLGEQQCQK